MKRRAEPPRASWRLSLLLPDWEPVTVAIDDTLFRRRGKKVWAASRFHDGSALGTAKTGYSNNWVTLGIVVRLPMVARPVAVPVMAGLVIKGTNSASRLWLADRMAGQLAAALPGRAIRAVTSAHFHRGDADGAPFTRSGKRGTVGLRRLTVTPGHRS